MQKHNIDPIECTTTADKAGSYTVVFTWKNEDQKTFYEVSADLVDEYESSGVGVDEFFYTLA